LELIAIIAPFVSGGDKVLIPKIAVVTDNFIAPDQSVLNFAVYFCNELRSIYTMKHDCGVVVLHERVLKR
jgi:hypothetical protein